MMNMLLTMVMLKRLFYMTACLIILSCVSFASLDATYTWLFFPVLLFSTAIQANSIKRFLTSNLVVILSVFVTLSIAFGLRAHPVWQTTSIIILSMFCTYLGKRYPAWIVTALFINLLALLALSLATTVFTVTWVIKALLLGIVVCAVLQIIIVVRFYRDELAFWRYRALYSLIQLTRDIFACLIQPEYNDNLYLFERRLHTQKIQFLAAAGKLRRLGEQLRSPILQIQTIELASHLSHVYAVLLECAQLRRRITDYTVFQLCEVELSAIADEVVKLMINITKKKNINLSKLNGEIARLESTYQQVIKVATREPLAFLLFIGGLKALVEELEAFAV
jgi:hypothetical protein